jgi:glycosyltransferase involved in cell wall biosynthesis
VESAARVEYVGRVEGGAKEAFFRDIDVLLVPSEWEEPAPLVVMEAAVRGVPSVVSDRGGLPESPEAQVFRAGDVQALLTAISSFVDTKGKLEGASRRLLERGDEFTWSTHMGRVEELLRSVV